VIEISRNVKMQVFVTPEFYLKLVGIAKKNALNVRSDSDLVNKLLTFYEEKQIDDKIHIEKIEENMLRMNKIIQEKEAAIQAALKKRVKARQDKKS